VLVALPGDYGKPRPAIVLQDDALTNNSAVQSVMVCPLTSYPTDTRSLRVVIEPDDRNGLSRRSEAMVEKITSVKAGRIRDTNGALDRDTMRAVERALLIALGFASQHSSDRA
jgi:mRNA interferase MazF